MRNLPAPSHILRMTNQLIRLPNNTAFFFFNCRIMLAPHPLKGIGPGFMELSFL
jgi:hypothetical protein